MTELLFPLKELIKDKMDYTCSNLPKLQKFQKLEKLLQFKTNLPWDHLLTNRTLGEDLKDTGICGVFSHPAVHPIFG